MPIPFLLGALGVAAGVLGVGGHLSAKDTNEKAQQVSSKAKRMYESAKASLEKKQKETQEALLNLGYSKKNILDNSMKQFLDVYERIKNVSVKESRGLNEISNFTIEQQDAIQLREMTSLYSSTITGSIAGAATGTIIALAVSGSLPLATASLSLAGTALSLGMVGSAASIAGSTVLAGLSATPLAAIIAPALLFTGFSASSKADENLEKANAMMAEAEAAVAKMEVSETLCDAIGKRAEMFDSLLGELNSMFSESVQRLQGILEKKDRKYHKSNYNSNDFSRKELELIAVTRSLAGAVKSVIDTPILNDKGEVTEESLQVCNNTADKLSAFTQIMETVK